LTVEGNSYSKSVTIEGNSLKLIGAGLREKWVFDVYTLAQYTTSGACGAKAQINKDEVKYIRIDMLRDVDAQKMATTLKEAFDNNTPASASAELKKQVNTFTGYFKKACTKGTKLEFLYIPGKGTSLKQNGKKLGPIVSGKAFADVLWGCYFSGKTCCPDLKKQILSNCK
jgi:Chalcone isomerase-like